MSTLVRTATATLQSMHNVLERTPPLPVDHGASQPTAEPDALAALREHATPVRARRRQRLSLTGAHMDAAYIVRSGLLCIEAAAPGKHRQLLTLFYPGDIIQNAFVPQLPAMTLSALGVAEVLLCRRATSVRCWRAIPPAAHVQRRLAEQHARAMLHAAVVGTLCGEDRVVSLLIELALRVGIACAGGVACEMPLSRADTADYLALNADTLSRITSRLRGRGLLTQTARGRIVLPDWDGLCALSPFAGALLALHAGAKRPPQTAAAEA
jgi:CRP-like cAMP-binding protein